MTLSFEDKLKGCLVGGAIGDAMGHFFEGHPAPVKYSLPDRWITSDDTALTLATCEAIVTEESVTPESIARQMCAWFREGRVGGIGASTLPDSNVRDRIREVRSFINDNTIQDCGRRFGVSGYVVDSVPLALAAATFLPRLGFTGLLEAVIECGGDTDTIASIAGQLAGTASGFGQLPTDLINQLDDYQAIREISSQLVTLKSKPYTRSELARLPVDCRPDRGDFCEKCSTWIPRFAEISDAEARSLRKLSKIESMKQVKQKVGCTLRWAKIWAVHPNGPEPRDAGPPCPYCHEPLRTKRAQQCLCCGADWHGQSEISGV